VRLKPRRQTEANKINPAHDRRLAAVSRHAITSSLTMVLANPIDLTPIGVEHAAIVKGVEIILRFKQPINSRFFPAQSVGLD